MSQPIPGLQSQSSIIALDTTDWHTSWRSRQSLLAGLAGRGWQVLYSSGPLFTWHRSTPRWRSAAWLGRIECDRGVSVYVPGRLCARFQRVGLLDRLACHLYCRNLRRASNKERRLVVLVFHPELWPYARRLQPDLLAYHAYDDFSRRAGWTSRLQRHQRELISRADLITAQSDGVRTALPPPGSQRAHVVSTGADLELAAQAAASHCPPDLAAVPGPRIGYVGNVNRKVDFPLVARLAEKNRAWQWVFVGPVHPVESSSPRLAEHVRARIQCQAMSNVHFLGRRPWRMAQHYTAHMDVSVIPYDLDPHLWARASDPLKLYESLALGKPVVSSDLPRARDFSQVVAIARTLAQWRDRIAEALDGRGRGTAEQRRAAAFENRWETRVDLLERLLVQALA